MIRQVSLRNFKAFQHCDLAFRPLTLLTGMNGVGKSSVIQSLCLLRQSHTAGLLETGMLLNGDLTHLGVGKDVLYERAGEEFVEINLVDGDASFSWRFSYDPAGDVLPIAAGPERGGPRQLFGRDFQYLRADRLGPATNYEKSFHAVSTQSFLGPRGEYAAHFLSVHRDDATQLERRLQGSDRVTPRLLAQVSAWMQEFSPGVTLEVFDVENTDLVRLAFQYGGSAGIQSSNYYRPTNVGFGLTYTLPVVIACLATDKGGLVLLENPEAHLHPHGQVAMGRLIAKCAAAGLQIVAETHSDHVLNGIRLSVKRGELSPGDVATHFFSREGDSQETLVESPEMTDSGRLRAWPAGFFDQWESSLDELLS